MRRGEDPLTLVSILLSQFAERAKTDTAGDVRLDVNRELRCGNPEVIYAPGKSIDALCDAVARLKHANQNCACYAGVCGAGRRGAGTGFFNSLESCCQDTSMDESQQ